MADVALVGAAVSRGMSDTARDGATIQVALTGRSGLAADLVRHLLTGQGDIAIVDAPWDAAAAFGVAVNAVDIVVFTDGEDGVPEPCRHLLFGDAGVPVIAVYADGKLVIYDRRV